MKQIFKRKENVYEKSCSYDRGGSHGHHSGSIAVLWEKGLIFYGPEKEHKKKARKHHV